MSDFTPCPKPPPREKRPRKYLKRTPLKRGPTAKGRKQIRENKRYYAEVIATKPHVCENCGKRIPKPTGSNVSHILGKGSNPALYYDKDNNYLLCKSCENWWTNGNKTTMNIYRESTEIARRLTLKYYTNTKLK